MASKYVLSFQVVFFCICVSVVNSVGFSYPAAFNFGDSNSDTGELAAAFGFRLSPPNNEQRYFNATSGRFCNGHLIVDFLMNGMNLPFLNAYMDSLGLPNFNHGCNFAAAGSTILPATVTSISPFGFGVQVSQFLLFKARVLELLAAKKSNEYVPAEDYFEKGLYIFDIGQNDISGAFYSKNLDQVLNSIPQILLEFETGIKKLYDNGARNFWIHNTGPLGCLAQVIATFGTNQTKLDELGCVSSHNQAAKTFNLQLLAFCSKLQGQYPDANVTYIDIFTIKSDLIANHSKYGFEQPIMACCGHGGPPLNYDNSVHCGFTITAKGCNDSTVYVNWDGIHYTEAANQYVASQILTGNFSNTHFVRQDALPSLAQVIIPI